MLFFAHQSPDTFDTFLESPGLTYGYALEALQVEFAEAVVARCDPAAAAQMLINHVSTTIGTMLEQAAMRPSLESPQLRKGLTESAERVRDIDAMVDKTHAGYAAWVEEIDAPKERYAAFPPVAEALASVGL